MKFFTKNCVAIFIVSRSCGDYNNPNFPEGALNVRFEVETEFRN